MARGSGPGGIGISGESLEEQLARAYRSGIEAATVRPKPFPDAKAWMVEESITSGVRQGEQLLFSRCRRVLRIGSTPEYLQSLITEVPVVEAEIESPRSLVLPAGKKLSDFDPPRRSDRFLLLFEPRFERWAFAVQTVGDLYLIREKRVFRLEWAEENGRESVRIWAPLPETSKKVLIDRARSALERDPDGKSVRNPRDRPLAPSGAPRS